MNELNNLQRQIVELRATTLTNDEIATRLGISPESMNSMLKRIRNLGVDLTLRRKGAHAAGWTPERIEKLKALWAEGKSASICARELGGGATRSAVIGKIHRLGLSNTRVPSPRPRVRLSTRPRRGAKQISLAGGTSSVVTLNQPSKRFNLPPAPSVAPVAPSAAWKPLAGITPVTLDKREHHHCRWPIEDDTPRYGLDRLFCGAPRAGCGSFCETHEATARRGVA